MFSQGWAKACFGWLLLSGAMEGLSLAADTVADTLPETPAAVSAEAAESTGTTNAAAIADAPATSALTVMAPAPAPPPKPPAPKKKAPPVFPGPKPLPPTGPYKPAFYDNDFSYLGKPDAEYVFGEETKLMQLEILDTNFVFSSGGELRHRFMSQDNRLQPGGPGQDTYNLTRWRHYLDLKGDNFRVYVEGIDASSFGEDLPVQAIDENRWDLQNAFLDVELFDTGTGTHTIRAGRQELLFGRQRLVSPLDWANTRRNFEGFRYLVKEKEFKLDLFAVNPVNSATGFNTVAEFDHKFDEANRDVLFGGAYFSYTAIDNTNIDLYYLSVDTEDSTGAGRADGDRHTVGSRYTELIPLDGGRVWDVDVEGAYQFGTDFGENVRAGFATGVLGHTWKNAPWSPRLSGLVYFGSGDRTAGDGKNNTFYTMFPLGHAYWAISDNLSGQNLLDYAAQLDLKPTKQTGVTGAYHVFNLASDGDRAYNIAGVPVGAPGNGTDLGQAFDLFGFYSVNSNLDIQAGYSWFWYGDYITSQPATNRDDASQFYIQTSLRY